jgi:hypothetical protein
MASQIQTIREGATAHPEELVDFMTNRLIYSTGGLFGIEDDDWTVSEISTPGMAVEVAEGFAIMKNAATDEMAYPIRLTGGSYQVTIENNSSGLDRIDSIVLYVDLGASPDAAATNVAKLVAVKGTAGASPTAPSSAQIESEVGADNPYIVLADVEVDNGVTEIFNADITDQRAGNDYYNKVSTFGKSLQDGEGLNYSLDVSVSSNNITVSLKDQAGNTPSKNSKCVFNVDGDLLVVNSSLSVTLDSADGDLFNVQPNLSGGQTIQPFVFIINNNGTLQIGISLAPNLRTVETNYKDSSGLTGSKIYNLVMMSGTRNATNSCRVIGRFSCQQTSGGNWSNADDVISRPIFQTDMIGFYGFYDTTTIDDGSGGQPTADFNKYIIDYNRLFFQVQVSGDKVSTNNAIIMTYAPFPMGDLYSNGKLGSFQTLGAARDASRAIVGTCFANSASVNDYIRVQYQTSVTDNDPMVTAFEGFHFI